MQDTSEKLPLPGEEWPVFIYQADELRGLKTRKYKTDISRQENMSYDKKTDSYTCKSGKDCMPAGPEDPGQRADT